MFIFLFCRKSYWRRTNSEFNENLLLSRASDKILSKMLFNETLLNC